MNNTTTALRHFRRVATAVLAPTAMAGLIVLAPTASAKGDKVTICHIPPGNPENAHSITISVNALQTHLDQHGDSIGECGGGGDGGDGGGEGG